MGRACGTTIVVKNLFFSTPARRKFLRSVNAEARQVAQTIIHLAAGYPALSFELEHQDRQILNYAPASRRERAAELVGIPVAELLDLVHEEEGLKIEGVLAGPEHCGRSKGKQYLIVQGPAHLFATAGYRCTAVLCRVYCPKDIIQCSCSGSIWIQRKSTSTSIRRNGRFAWPTKGRSLRLLRTASGRACACPMCNPLSTLRLQCDPHSEAGRHGGRMAHLASMRPVAIRLAPTIRSDRHAWEKPIVAGVAKKAVRHPASPGVATTHDVDDQLALTFRRSSRRPKSPWPKTPRCGRSTTSTFSSR